MRLDNIDLLEECIAASDKGAWESRWAWAEAVRKSDYLCCPSGRLRHGKATELCERANKAGFRLTTTEIQYRLLLYKKAPTRQKLIQIADEFESYNDGRLDGFTPKQPEHKSRPQGTEEQPYLYADWSEILVKLEAETDHYAGLFEGFHGRPEAPFSAVIAEFDQREARVKEQWSKIRQGKKTVDEVLKIVPNAQNKSCYEIVQSLLAICVEA